MSKSGFIVRALCLGLGLTLGACNSSSEVAQALPASAVALAACGEGSQPETGLQGQVPLADRQSGRNLSAYSCNLKLVGQYQGHGASVVSPSQSHCAYLSTSGALLDPLQLLESNPGVYTVDASDATQPRFTANLTGPSMSIGTWESLKTNAPRQLLGGVAVGALTGVGFFDVYDISQCESPVHLNGIGDSSLELPDNLFGHEGNWTPDGLTYWSTGNGLGTITAIDASQPQAPRILYAGIAGFPVNHGAEFSADGNTMYLATCFPGGVTIYDVSEVQSRQSTPAIHQLGSVSWNPFSCGQHGLPVSWNGKPYLIAPDEFDSEGIHILDISDPGAPKIVKQIQLEIQRKEHAATRAADTAGSGLFGYESHYCTVDRAENPRALACGYFQSGIRVFDVQDPLQPREIAYYNPPAQTGKGLSLQHSLHAWIGGLLPTVSDLYTSDAGVNLGTFSIDARYVGNYVAQLPSLLTNLGDGGPVSGNLSADWCSSPPRFFGNQLWVSCMDNGFLVLEFTNGVYTPP